MKSSLVCHFTILLAQFFYLTVALPQWYQGYFRYSSSGPSTKSWKGYEPDNDNEKFFDQRLDHFDRSLDTTFRQRYFINDTYWKGDANAPVFLCVGGEGPPLDRTVLVSSVHCNDMVELAPKHNALMLALEHRYYGPSNPFGDFATENLKWLNTEQALGDLAYFVSMINGQYKLTGANRWVTWGGSYPGMVAALARLRYPHLIYASVSSSAPLQATLDMTGYNDVVGEAMAAVSVGGSEACLNTVVEGHQEVGKQLATKTGRRYLEDLFNICIPGMLENTKNQEQFAGMGVVYLPAQSNDPACTTPYCDIGSICKLLTDTTIGTPIERLATLSKAQNPACKLPSYDAVVEFYSSPKNPDRSWLYQTCTEWGFYQTCNTGSKCPYTQGLHTVDTDLDLCQKAFSVSADTVKAQIANTLSIYGGVNIQSSRILSTNGEIDPWHANSVLVAPNSAEPAQYVIGASHHFWTHPSLPTDSDEVNKAREVIWNQVSAWLAEGVSK